MSEHRGPAKLHKIKQLLDQTEPFAKEVEMLQFEISVPQTMN